MSYFDEAYEKTMEHEGYYSNDPDDPGGETYKGISRIFNPSWDGWKLIDLYKTIDGFPSNLKFMDNLQKTVKIFYKLKYFDVFCGDELDKNLAMKMFDCAVNLGTYRAILFLQKSLNVLNRNEKLYKDLFEDGSYGKKTHTTLKTYLITDSSELLAKLIMIQQGNYYFETMRKSPSQEKYARGWFNRIYL